MGGEVRGEEGGRGLCSDSYCVPTTDYHLTPPPSLHPPPSQVWDSEALADLSYDAQLARAVKESLESYGHSQHGMPPPRGQAASGATSVEPRAAGLEASFQGEEEEEEEGATKAEDEDASVCGRADRGRGNGGVSCAQPSGSSAMDSTLPAVGSKRSSARGAGKSSKGSGPRATAAAAQARATGRQLASLPASTPRSGTLAPTGRARDSVSDPSRVDGPRASAGAVASSRTIAAADSDKSTPLAKAEVARRVRAARQPSLLHSGTKLFQQLCSSLEAPLPVLRLLLVACTLLAPLLGWLLS